MLVAGVGCGGGETTTVATTTVTTTTAPADAPAPGTTGHSYTGTTDQGLPIALVVSKDAVTGIRFGWRARCHDGQVHTNSIVIRGGPIRHGGFSVGGALETGGVAHVAGTISGSTASGHLSRSKGSAFGTNCRVTGIAWQARLQSGDAPAA
jgi:hypothetical protein